ncbi:MAG TPA: cytidylate kinase-like family protein [Methylomirabilota bacterium]|jgi:cytidylate kinase
MPSRAVTISHTTGAGGEAIGRTVADRLGFRYIDEEIITLAAEKEGVDAELVADTERRKGFLARLFAGLSEGPVDVGVPGSGVVAPDAAMAHRSEDLRRVIIEAIHDMARRGQVVIASHAASIPLAGRGDVLRALVTAPFDTRAKRVARDGLRGANDPARFVRDSDAGRADYFQRFYGIERELPTHYDLVVNTEVLTPDEATDVIVAAARRRA